MATQSGSVVLSWDKLNIYGKLSRSEIKKNKSEGSQVKERKILDNVSGTFAGGTFTAIMGASGSGKTTLLNFLSGRDYYLKGLRVEGEMLINGNRRQDTNFRELTAYVMQEDVLIGSLTVRESLEFMAQLRLKQDSWNKYVDLVLDVLELRKVEYNRIGTDLEKGISGGEKKRTSVALELLTGPKLLFLDEPTTGLDSHSAQMLINTLRRLMDNGVTVICTIHQPNSFIYMSFQHLMLLAEGQIVYQGLASDAVDHFASVGLKCPRHANPAEYFIEILSPFDEQYEERIKVIKDNKLNIPPDRSQAQLPTIEKRDAGSWLQFKLLCWRALMNLKRNKMIVPFKVITGFTFICIILLAYFQVANETDEQSVTDRAGFLFFYIVLMVFVAIQSASGYQEERAMFVREQANASYSPVLWYLSKVAIDMPIDMVINIIYAIIAYLIVGLSLEEGSQLAYWVLLIVILTFYAKGLGNALVIAIANPQASAAAGPFLGVVQLLFSGLFINFDDIPDYLIPIEYISSFKYAWSAAMQNEFDTWDIDECGSQPVCDPIEYFSITIDFEINLLVLAILGFAVNLWALIMVIKLAYDFRK